MKVYDATGVGEDDRLEALQILANHGFSADDVYRLEVEEDHLTVYQYQSPRHLGPDGDVATLDAVTVPLVSA